LGAGEGAGKVDGAVAIEVLLLGLGVGCRHGRKLTTRLSCPREAVLDKEGTEEWG
jgi:hypothetical protein